MHQAPRQSICTPKLPWASRLARVYSVGGSVQHAWSLSASLTYAPFHSPVPCLLPLRLPPPPLVRSTPPSDRYGNEQSTAIARTQTNKQGKPTRGFLLYARLPFALSQPEPRTKKRTAALLPTARQQLEHREHRTKKRKPRRALQARTTLIVVGRPADKLHPILQPEQVHVLT